MNFELGGITIPINAGLEFSQSYEMSGGTVTQRMQSGRAIKQTHFNKLRTVLSGQGWVPAGLDGLDYSIPLLLRCAAPRSVSSTNTQFTIPVSRRHDFGFEPKAYAVVLGNLVETEITLNVDIVTLDVVSGAHIYQVHYYPEMLVFTESPQVQGNMTGAEFSWTLTCEEV